MLVVVHRGGLAGRPAHDEPVRAVVEQAPPDPDDPYAPPKLSSGDPLAG
ncbi:MAG TPA: hypothetical protein VM266_03260 [Solirubrobacteraceae bacterium]|nr:hypothetical protein [Solirubrobacteraceae bacterium]